MFVRVETRRRALPPWATVAIAIACVVGFLYALSLEDVARDAFLRRWGTVPAELFGRTGWSVDALLAARPLTLLSALFLHADWLHLLGNLVFLLIFGLGAERLLGSRRFLALFVLCGAIANLGGAITLGASPSPIIGASGAVSAIVGAYLALFPGARLGLVLPLGLFLEFVRVPASLLIGFWVILQAIFSFVGPAFGRVAWTVHLAGFIAGALFAILSRPAIAKRLRG
ncbi:MAG TPA: rhomboid family intramembrane serine protease [Xanthomonadales bacterium]|nr:rhomboid family intramembrane serine protease [Xanthomonadales bacterium]